jgi:hypothetical protein
MSKRNRIKVVKKNMAVTAGILYIYHQLSYFPQSGLSSGAVCDGGNTHFQ